MSADASITPASPAEPAPKVFAAKSKPVTKLVKKPAAKKKVAAKPTSSTKKAAAKDINRSAEIRKVASSMKAKGIKPRPSVIAAELGTKGIAVTPTLVSIVLKGMGFRPLRRRKKSAGNTATTSKGGATKRSSGTQPISVDELVAAKKAVTALGGSERAMEAIAALRRLED